MKDIYRSCLLYIMLCICFSEYAFERNIIAASICFTGKGFPVNEVQSYFTKQKVMRHYVSLQMCLLLENVLYVNLILV